MASSANGRQYVDVPTRARRNSALIKRDGMDGMFNWRTHVWSGARDNGRHA